MLVTHKFKCLSTCIFSSAPDWNLPDTHFKENKLKYANGYKGNTQWNVEVRHEGNNNQSGTHAVVQPAKSDNKNRIQGRLDDNKQGNNKGHFKVRTKAGKRMMRMAAWKKQGHCRVRWVNVLMNNNKYKMPLISSILH